MATKTEIRFRLKPRWFIDSQTGERKIDDDNSLITMRITYGAMRLEYSTGYHIKAAYWDTNAGYAIGGSFGKSSDEINGGLVRFKKSAIETIKLFQEKEVMPTQMEFKDTFKRINEGIQISTNPNIEKKTSTRKRAVENGDNNKSNSDNTCSTESFNNLSREQKTKEITKTFTFWDIYHEYEAYASKLNDWSAMTRKKYETIRFNIRSFRDWKRQNGLPNFEVTFDYFDEDGLQSFVDYLRDVKQYVNTTIRKDIVMLKVVIRWAFRKRYHNNMFEAFRPALKSAPKKVIFLNRQELEKLEKFDIPNTKLYLTRVRDVFLFQCYTGIRYSDLANLKRCDIHENHIEITTIKTCDSLKIELNSHSRAILKKYEPFEFKNGKALPVVSNQKMNQFLQEFMLELGNGFCFEARQKRILVDEEYYYMDMVFYNRAARFGVILELKSHRLDYKDVAQLNMYLSYYRKNMMQEDDNPPVGILLCTAVGKEMVEYATSGIDENLFISKYLLKLPSKDEMERWLYKELKELR
jgi:integrase